MADARPIFTLEGLDELKNDLQKVYKKYPDESAKEIYRLAGVFTKDVNAKMPGEYSRSKKEKAEAKAKGVRLGKKIPESWKRERARVMGSTASVEVRNTAPHWHLVENGHMVRGNPRMYAALTAGRLDQSKRTKKYKAKSRSKNPNLAELGWAPGKGYCEQTRDEWGGGKFAEHIGTFVDAMLKEENL